MVARSRSGARSGIRGAQRFRAVAQARSSRCRSCSRPEAGDLLFQLRHRRPAWPVAIPRASSAPAACTSARPAASCGSNSRDSAARAVRSSLSWCFLSRPAMRSGAARSRRRMLGAHEAAGATRPAGDSAPARCRRRPGRPGGPGPPGSTPGAARGRSRGPSAPRVPRRGPGSAWWGRRAAALPAVPALAPGRWSPSRTAAAAQAGGPGRPGPGPRWWRNPSSAAGWPKFASETRSTCSWMSTLSSSGPDIRAR